MTTQEERNERLQNWEKNKRRWYNTYLFTGIGINFLLYFTKPYGFDPSGSIFWGSVFGLGIPLATMFGLSYLHQKLLGLQKLIKSSGMLLGIWLALVCAMPAPVCLGDVLFVHDYQSDEYLMGKQESELRVGYTPRAMLVDKQTRYTGSWMKRFFGEVKEQRDTTHFLLEKRQIREIDWYKNKILTLPFENMQHARMLQANNAMAEGAAQIINARYEVSEPVFSITVDPETKTVGGYPCRYIKADLRLETRDLKKSAASITLISQHLWVSDAVPGADQYDDFHRRLAETLGLEAERLGQLNFLLRYWQGPLDPIRESLIRIKGYPVQNDFFLEAQYVKNTNSPTPAVISKMIKKERMTLSEAKVMETLDESRFAAVGPFSEVTLQ